VGGPASAAPVVILLLGCFFPTDGAPGVAAPIPVADAATSAGGATAVWPAPNAPLKILEVPKVSGRRRVLVDGGHGADGNDGNTSARCERESAFTRREQDDLAARLAKIPGFEVDVTRKGDARPSYDDRLAQMAKWPADAVISLHSDARTSDVMGTDPTTGCPFTDHAEGFSVLYSDEGDPALAGARLALARRVATKLKEAGFPPFFGNDYDGLYAADPVPGVWVDRHEDSKRIKMLRRSTVPLVIVETHQATDPDEVARWDEDRTHEALAAAIAAALAD
jgi:N-acetylmuramoyl-L-alanine amidase